MYRAFVRKRIHTLFDHLSQGDYEYALAGVGKSIEHRFAGDQCLGGTRTSVPAMREWFKRLYRLFPNLQFELHSIAVCGGPLHSTVAVEWTDRATPADGGPYVNHEAHVIRLHRGKVMSIHAYLDTYVVETTLQRMARNGIAEAAAPPIVGA